MAITSGYYERLKNDGEDLPKRPSLFHYFLESTKLPSEAAWIISSKGKLDILAQTRDKDYQKIKPKTFCGIDGKGGGYANDDRTEPYIEQILFQKHPRLVLINLLEVDVNGHAKNWEGYLNGIRKTDAYASRLWSLIQNDSIYKDKTTLFITNDHGRHLDNKKSGFAEHGDGCEGYRHISLLALGPDFEKGKIVQEKYEMIDIAPTIAKMLNFEMPTAKGKPIYDLLKP